MGVRGPRAAHLLEPRLRPLTQLGQRTELDRVRRTRLRAGRLLVVLQPVVTERALPHATVVLALVEHAERTRWNAVAAAVAHVLLHHHRSELRAEERTRRAHLEASRVRAVLAHVRGHEPTHLAELLTELATGGVLGERIGHRLGHVRCLALLDEGNVAPGVRPQALCVVHRPARVVEAVLGHLVPLLAGHLAGLAAYADARVGEEAHALASLVTVGADLELSAHRPPSRGSRPRSRAAPGRAGGAPESRRTWRS